MLIAINEFGSRQMSVPVGGTTHWCPMNKFEQISSDGAIRWYIPQISKKSVILFVSEAIYDLGAWSSMKILSQNHTE